MSRVQYDVVLVDRVPVIDQVPSLNEIDRLIVLDNITWAQELNNDGFASVSTRPERLPQSIKDRLIAFDENPMELWIFRDGVHVYAGPVIGYQVQGQNKTITFHSRGLQYYLRYMFLTADFKRDATDSFVVVRDLVDHWQDQNYGNFGIFHEIGLPTSGNDIDVDYKRAEIVNIARAIADLSLPQNTGFDFEIDPSDRTLYLYSPEKGTNKTSTINIDRRNMTQYSVYVDTTAGGYGSTVVGAGTSFELTDGPLWSQKTNSTRRAQFGYAGLGAKWSGITSQATLDDYVQAMVDVYSNFPISFGGSGGESEGGTTRIEVTEGMGPLDIETGDYIQINLELGFGNYDTGRFVIDKVVTQDSTGYESMSLGLA